jgi:hypothetical protein
MGVLRVASSSAICGAVIAAYCRIFSFFVAARLGRHSVAQVAPMMDGGVAMIAARHLNQKAGRALTGRALAF